MQLAWIVKGWDEDPLRVVPQVRQVLIPNQVAQVLEVPTYRLKRLLIAVLVRDEATSADHNGWQHALKRLQELFKGAHLTRLIQVQLTEHDDRLLRLHYIALFE